MCLLVVSCHCRHLLLPCLSTVVLALTCLATAVSCHCRVLPLQCLATAVSCHCRILPLSNLRSVFSWPFRIALALSCQLVSVLPILAMSFLSFVFSKLCLFLALYCLCNVLPLYFLDSSQPVLMTANMLNVGIGLHARLLLRRMEFESC